MANACLQLAKYEEALAWARKSARRHPDNLPAHHVLAASAAHLGRGQEAEAAIGDVLERDPALTIARLKEIYPVARYKNLDGFIDGLRKAGLPE